MINVWSITELTTRVKKVLAELQDTTSNLTGATITNATIVGGISTATAVCTPHNTAGAIDLSEGVVVITATSAINLTVAAPTTSQNGTIITVMSATNYAHTVTFTGGTFFNGTSSAKTTATFAAYKGATLRFVAYGGGWYQSGLTAVTMS